MLDLDRFVAGVSSTIRSAVQPLAERIKALEQRTPERGEKGDRGETGLNGKDGRDGKDGVDGRSISVEELQPIIEVAIARGLLDLERRAQDVLQKAVDRLPAPKDGKDGRDALQVDDFELSLSDDERTLTVALACGDRRVEKSVRLSHPIHRGVYKAGEAYEKGDCVSFGGSTWSATRDTSAKPETDDSWRLIVKRGRDGRDGEKGDPGPKGDRGPANSNVMHMHGVR